MMYVNKPHKHCNDSISFLKNLNESSKKKVHYAVSYKQKQLS